MKSLLYTCLLLGPLGLAGCGSDAPAQPTSTTRTYQGTLDVDVRGKAEVTLVIGASGVPEISLQVDSVNAEGLLDGKVAMKATGKVEPFPEIGSVLYTAKLAQPALAGGPCGGMPLSLALSLHRRGSEARVAGSLTAYCGEGHFFGTPVRILRLTGELPLR